MEFVHEITAFLENKPGRLAKICSALAHEKVDLRALSVMDTNGRSVLRFVTDHVEETAEGPHLARHRVLRPARSWPSRWRTDPGPWRGSWSGWPRSTSTSNTPTSASSAAPGRSLGIFHTSNPKRAQQVLAESPGNGAGHSPQRRPLHSR